jgi:O-acetylhomoserine/O-acetylserine sulfhydrylase-like pyridoxal-dependent enzyme
VQFAFWKKPGILGGGGFFIAFIFENKNKNFKPLKMDLTEGSETSANINQTLGKHPKVDTVKYKKLQKHNFLCIFAECWKGL